MDRKRFIEMVGMLGTTFIAASACNGESQPIAVDLDTVIKDPSKFTNQLIKFAGIATLVNLESNSLAMGCPGGATGELSFSKESRITLFRITPSTVRNKEGHFILGMLKEEAQCLDGSYGKLPKSRFVQSQATAVAVKAVVREEKNADQAINYYLDIWNINP